MPQHYNHITIGIIGYGKHLRRSHFLHIFCKEKSYISVKGYFDPGADDRVVQEDFAQTMSKPIKYQTLEALLADSEINAVFIGSPDHFHADQLALSVKANKHIFVEKPLASSKEQIESVLASLSTAKEKGLIISTCHPRRTDHQFEYLKERFFSKNTSLLTSFGNLLHLQYRFAYHQMSTEDVARQWKNQRGLLVDHACHEIDLVRYLCPTATEITPGCVVNDSPDHYELFGTYKYNEHEVSYHFTGHRFLEPRRYIEQTTLLFEGGEVHLNCETGELRINYQNTDKPKTEIINLGLPNYDAKFHSLTENFFDLIRGQDDDGKPVKPYVTLEDITMNVLYPFQIKYFSNLNNLEWCDLKQNNIKSVRAGQTYDPILQYDLNGKLIKKWNSVTEASKSLNIHGLHIWHCLNNKDDKAGGYIWKFDQ